MPGWMDVGWMGCLSLAAHPSDIHPSRRHFSSVILSLIDISWDIKTTLTLSVLTTF
jgi:hypothetical protein